MENITNEYIRNTGYSYIDPQATDKWDEFVSNIREDDELTRALTNRALNIMINLENDYSLDNMKKLAKEVVSELDNYALWKVVGMMTKFSKFGPEFFLAIKIAEAKLRDKYTSDSNGSLYLDLSLDDANSILKDLMKRPLSDGRDPQITDKWDEFVSNIREDDELTRALTNRALNIMINLENDYSLENMENLAEKTISELDGNALRNFVGMMSRYSKFGPEFFLAVEIATAKSHANPDFKSYKSSSGWLSLQDADSILKDLMARRNLIDTKSKHM